MISYDEALRLVLSHARALPPERVKTGDALGCVLSGDVFAPLPLPSFTNSQMDGYALCWADWAGGQQTFPVSGTVAAGDGDVGSLTRGRAVRVMTGAPLPVGADTVIPIEDTDAGLDTVQIGGENVAGQYLRRAGEDIGAGEMALPAGTVLTPAGLGLLSSLGLDYVWVHRRPRVALLSTGDELTLPGHSLGPGRVYNANFTALAAQCEAAGAVVVTTLEQSIVGDDRASLRVAFDMASGVDVMLTSGGVSVGAYDFVKEAWQERGTLEFWRVAIRPGKPLAFGLGRDGSLFFGVPGNILSAMVTWELYIRPVLLTMRGLRDPVRPLQMARLTHAASHEPGRRSFGRGTARQEGGAWTVTPLSGQGSHLLRAAALSNALYVLSEDREKMGRGGGTCP